MKQLFLLFSILFFSTIYGFSQAPIVDDLKETFSEQSRDLSLPDSRIVINPFDFKKSGETSPSDYSNAPNLPLNTGYLSTERVNYRVVKNILNLYSYVVPDEDATLKTIWTGDLKNASAWKNESQTTVEITDDGLKFAVGSNPSPVWKSLTNVSPVQVDFDKNTMLYLSVKEFAGGKWSLKMRDAGGAEIVLRGDAPDTGVFYFPLTELSGWSGTKAITFYLFVIDKNSHIVVNDYKLLEYESDFPVTEAIKYQTAWMPNELPFEAKYDDESTLKGTDFFYDIHTIVRRVSFQPKNEKSKLLLTGAYSGDDVTFEENTLIQDKGVYSIAISANAFGEGKVKFYSSIGEMKMQIGGNAVPSKQGYWAVEIDPAQSGDLIASVAYSYENDKEDKSVLLARAQAPLKDNNAATQYEAVKQYWNDYLAKVPQPAVFDIETVAGRNVMTGDVRQNYYKAWTFIASNLLMGDPVKYPYPQVVTGKASMWDEGDDLAPYSATWESFCGIQFLAFTDTENAWKALQGLMSLTDKNGVIGGESLPSRKAQTAWLLYEMTGDSEKLTSVYDELERYLNWRMKYPHWIYNSSADETKKDAEFVFSAVLDIQFMSKIAKVVKDENAASAWDKKAHDFFEESLGWFWSTPASLPVQYYNTKNKSRDAGNTYWVTTGLFIDMLEGEYLKSTYKLFDVNFNSNNNFGGGDMGWAKYPDVSYTVYGLVQKGYVEYAENVIDASLRDLVRSGCWFAEQYAKTGIPYPSGVRPSLFGACMAVDFVMMKNGFMYGTGTPAITNLFSGGRGIEGIHFGDKTINVSRGADNRMTVSGTYLKNGYTETVEAGSYQFIDREREPSSAAQTAEKNKSYSIYTDGNSICVSLNFSAQKPVSLKLMSIDGKLVSVEKTYSSTGQLTINNVERGTYLLILSIENDLHSEKIVL